MKNIERVALVTGASKGIGAAVANRLAQDGFAVVVNYAGSKDEADEVVRGITSAEGRAVAVQAAVSDPAAVRAFFDETEVKNAVWLAQAAWFAQGDATPGRSSTS